MSTPRASSSCSSGASPRSGESGVPGAFDPSPADVPVPALPAVGWAGHRATAWSQRGEAVAAPQESLPLPKASVEVDAPAQAVTAAASSRVVTPRAGRTYTVQPGDSLWSIAERLLGPRATNSQIVALIDRIWKLNADRIGTGEPSLIIPGQRLPLPADV
jgi:nucleoid-associated protein YgaU